MKTPPRTADKRGYGRAFFVELCGVGAPYRRRAGKGGAFRDRSSPASGPGHPSQMGGVRRRAKQYFATRLPHPWSLSFGHPWPNRSLQAPPLPRSLCSGTATGQTDRVRTQPGPFYGARFVGACLASERPAKVAPQDSRDTVGAAVRKVSGILPGLRPFRGRGPLAQLRLPFAGRARSHKARSQNRVSRRGRAATRRVGPNFPTARPGRARPGSPGSLLPGRRGRRCWRRRSVAPGRWPAGWRRGFPR